jgi:hypothetical protein
VTVAVSVKTVPGNAVTVTTILMVTVTFLARFPTFTVTGPLLPTAGDVTAP